MRSPERTCMLGLGVIVGMWGNDLAIFNFQFPIDPIVSTVQSPVLNV